jgi:hypothetical protein
MYPSLTLFNSDNGWNYEKDENGLNDWEGVAASLRVRPVEVTLTPFLKAFIEAAQAMHCLRRAMLWTSMTQAAGDVDDTYDMSTFDAAAEISTGHTSPLMWGIVFAQAREKVSSTCPGMFFTDGRQIWWKAGRW